MKHYSTQMNQSFDVGWAKLYPVSIQISAGLQLKIIFN